MIKNNITDNEIQDLKKEGILKIENVFTSNEINNIIRKSEKLFQKNPFGELKDQFITDKKKKKWSRKLLLEPQKKEKDFIKAFNKKIFKSVILSILGKNYIRESLLIRKVPKNVKNNQIVHKDSHGFLHICILLNNAKFNSGGTFYYPRTHISTPPPQFCKVNNENEVQTEGKKGDVYFFLTDGWHGGARNLSNSPNSQLMIIFKKKPIKKKSFFSKIFVNMSDSPKNGIVKELLFQFISYKNLFLTRFIKKKYLYFALSDYDSYKFSFFKYFGKIDVFKSTKIYILNFLNIFISFFKRKIKT